jgi:hypothetical protein
MNRWSDWDFKATSKDNVLLYAWTTPFQMDVVEADLEGWSQVHVDKAKEEGSSETKVTDSSLVSIQEHAAAQIDLEMTVEGGTTLTMRGLTMAMRGQMFHLAAVAASDRAGNAQKALDKAAADMELKVLPEALVWGAAVESEVSSATLNGNWRAPLKSEMPTVVKMAKALTVPTFLGCWSAIHPVAGTTPDVMITCQDKKTLGIVDEYTFDDVQADLKTAWFGTKTEAESDSMTTEDGRMGLLFTSKVAGQSIHILGVANDQGIAKTIVAGKGTSKLDLGVELLEVAKASTIAAPIPMEFRDVGIYYLTYRPFHPYVLGPIILALIVFIMIMVLIVIGARRPPTYDEF